jgi:hypothetical protein
LLLIKRHYPAVILIGLACLVQWALLLAITTPAWDAAFYYAYARSVVFDGDLEIENDLQLAYPTSAPDFARRGLDEVRTETGRVASPFAVGSSLLWLPWLALLRLVAETGWIGDLSPGNLNGYETLFVAGLATLSMLFGWLAFWIAYGVASAETGRFNGLAATLILLFSTPLLYYLYREPLYSHGTSALVTGLVVLAWWRQYRRRPAVGQALLVGGLIGLAALVRWQHLVYLVLPMTSAAFWWWSLPADERRAGGLQVVGYLVAVGAAALAVFSIQLVQWQLFYGTWLTVPQGGAYVDWRAPFWRPVLFSTFRGLLAWMPVVFWAALGLILQIRRQPRLVVPLLLVLLLETYVNSSTRDWFGGGGFGPRRYTSETVILVIGCAVLLQALRGRIGRPAAMAGGVLLATHQWILLRYGLGEKIGGYIQSMYPTYEWVDESYANFVNQMASHLADIVRTPYDFFVLPGSPISLASRGLSWSPQVTALLSTAIFLLLLWLLGRWLLPRLLSVVAGGWSLVLLVAAVILAANWWLLSRA